MKNVEVVFSDGVSKRLSLSQAPDTCPICHYAIDPISHVAFCNLGKWRLPECLQAIFRCTRQDCMSLFIAYYRALDTSCHDFIYITSKPISLRGRTFTDTINNISPNFCEIYNQSLSAEQKNLNEICGVGYRKALEFLIKDYLIKKFPEEREDIISQFLGQCIEQNITNDKIKNMAKRATWLGNDETHYLRKWEEKDLKDLKKLIDATLYWIEIEKLTEDIQQEMPEK